MTGPSPATNVAQYDALPIHTGQEFTLAVTERRYRESLSLPADSATRQLLTTEYIWALEESLHGRAVA